ncbi:MAG: SUMF1/EgtB/PvdO family nonheme iron enzyme [Polyangiaceae bacterium]
MKAKLRGLAGAVLTCAQLSACSGLLGLEQPEKGGTGGGGGASGSSSGGALAQGGAASGKGGAASSGGLSSAGASSNGGASSGGSSASVGSGGTSGSIAAGAGGDAGADAGGAAGESNVGGTSGGKGPTGGAPASGGATTGTGGAVSISGGASTGGASATGGASTTGGAAAGPPSCAGAPNDCGANADESCCLSLKVTGGMFYRYSNVSSQNPNYPAVVSDFKLDKFEVTVGRYRKFVTAWVAGYRPAAGSGKHSYLNSGSGLVGIGGGYETGWVEADAPDIPATRTELEAKLLCSQFQTWTPSVGANEHLPINCLDRVMAEAFCIWDGGFLPSQAEINYASSAGNEQRVYPWGSAEPGPDTQLANYDCRYGGGTGGPNGCLGSRSFSPVGSIPAGNGRYGHADLSGNVAEWIADQYYGFGGNCFDCIALTTSGCSTNSCWSAHGGSFSSPASHLITSFFMAGERTQRDPIFGVRCARAPQ